MERTTFIAPESIDYHYSDAATSPQLKNIQTQLEQESHLFIVCLGMLIGMTISLFIGYHLNTTLINIFLLMSLPVVLTYCLRKFYIHTLIHYQD